VKPLSFEGASDNFDWLPSFMRAGRLPEVDVYSDFYLDISKQGWANYVMKALNGIK
jgi:hypothetical protein